MPNFSIASNQTVWTARPKDIKSYFHFDSKIEQSILEANAQNDGFVETHGFYPLIRFREKWIKFRKNGAKKLKSRPIRYSCRMDAAIYAYYRFKVSESYEQYLVQKKIEHIPVAYRKIPKADGGNKSNIELAKDAFDFIRQAGECDVTVVDISSFFENLDHELLKNAWEKVIGRQLNKAELSVFKSVTEYAVVDIEPLFKRLGMYKKYGTTKDDLRARKIDKLKKSKKKRIASRKEFLDLVCGGNPKFPSLIQKHNLSHGIPQGTPISDILANLYLIDFDIRLARWIRNKNGFACRYSDDIIVIIPRSENLPSEYAYNYLSKSIKNFGNKLEIKPSKTAIGRFLNPPSGQIYTHLSGASCQNGIEYLGFQFDGKKVQLKNSTLSNAWRKLHKRVHGWAKKWVKRFRNKGDDWLFDNAPLKGKTTEVLRTMTFPQSEKSDLENWTFISYVKRAEKAFGDYDTNFDKQTKKYRNKTYQLFEESLIESIRRNGYKAFIDRGGSL